jgi:FdhD protein
MVTMRTPGNDEDLLTGLLFSEGIIRDTSEIDEISVKGKMKVSMILIIHWW